MRRLVPLQPPAWSLPLIVLALVTPSIAGFALVGPQLGVAIGALTATAVIVVAARARYDEPIEVAARADRRQRVLVLTTAPIEPGHDVEAIARIATEGQRALRSATDEPQVFVLVPAVGPALSRWLSDTDPARDDAGGALAVSLGALTAAGLDAEGAVGDADPVQAIEDELRTFPAREIVVARGPGLGDRELEHVRRRVDRPVTDLAQETRSINSA